MLALTLIATSLAANTFWSAPQGSGGSSVTAGTTSWSSLSVVTNTATTVSSPITKGPTTVLPSPPPSPNTIQPQDFTSLPVAYRCAGPLDETWFEGKPVNEFICADYFRALIAQGLGVVINPVLFGTTGTGDFSIVTTFWDNEVRSELAGYEFSGRCNELEKTAQSCKYYFHPCNYTVDEYDYVVVPECRESCYYTYGCTSDPTCKTLDMFNSSNVTQCALNSMALDVELFSASTVLSVSALLALIF